MDHTDMNFSLQVLDLPLHPLVVHAVVVLLPLAVIAVVLSQFSGAARRRLGAFTPILAAVVAILVPVTIAAGRSLADIVGPLPTHERYGTLLLPWTLGLVAVAVVQWAWFNHLKAGIRQRAGARAVCAGTAAIGVAVVAVAVGNLILLFLAGDTGSRAVWGNLSTG